MPDLPKKPLPGEEDQQLPKKPQMKEPEAPPEKKPAPKKKTPAEKKDDRFKYEMQYINGGFNNGVEIKPDTGGKMQLKISIYGGGEQKTLKVYPLPKDIEKMVKAYEISANDNMNTPEITSELQKYTQQLKMELSMKIIDLLKDMDQKVLSIIKETFSRNKNK